MCRGKDMSTNWKTSFWRIMLIIMSILTVNIILPAVSFGEKVKSIEMQSDHNALLADLKNYYYYENLRNTYIFLLVVGILLFILLYFVLTAKRKKKYLLTVTENAKNNNQQKEFLNQLYENIPCGIVHNTISTPSEFTYMNRAGKKIFGFDDNNDATTINGYKVIDRITEKSKAEFHNVRSQLKAIGDCCNYELEILRSDGTTSWILGTAYRTLDFNGVEIIQGYFIDNTEKKQFEDSLAQREARLLATVENSAVFSWELDEINHTCKLDFRCQREYQLPDIMENFPESLIAFGRIAMNSRKTFRNMHTRLNSGEKIVVEDIETILPNGNSSWQRLKYNNIFDESGAPIMAFASAQAIDDYKEMENTFLIASKQNGLTTWIYDIGKKRIILDKDMEDFSIKPYLANSNPEKIKVDANLHPDDRQSIMEMYNNLIGGQKEVCCIARWRSEENESWLWYKISYSVIFDNGEPAKAIGSAIDVTEQMIAKQKYEENLQYQTIVGSKVVVYYRVNLATSVIEEYRSENQNQNIEYEIKINKDTMKKILEAVCYQNDKEKVESTFTIKGMRTAYEEGKTEVELTYKRLVAGKGKIWVTTRAVMMKNPDTNEIVAFVYTFDVNEKVLTHNMVDAIVNIDYDFISYLDISHDTFQMYSINDGNRAPARFVNNFEQYNIEYIKRLVVTEDVDKLIKEMSYKNIQKQLEEKKVYYTSIFGFQTEKEGIRKKRVSYTYLDKENQLLTLTRIDVTNVFNEEQRQNDALKTALKAAEQASEAKGEFLSRMSHEVRTPLNAIIGLNLLSKNNLEDKAIVADNLEKVDTSARFLLALINDILDVSRIESGKMILTSELIDAKHFIRIIDTIIRTQTKEKGIEFRTNIIGKVHSAYYGDAIKLQQVLINLLGNALKFTPTGGNILFTLEELEVEEEIAKLQFKVSDTGVGVSKDFLPNIFNAFEQEHQGVNTEYEGTGLGLTICKKIIDSMGGNIIISSELGKGSTFTVIFDLKIAEDAKSINNFHDLFNEKNEMPKEYNFYGKKVLLAEDHPLNIEVAKRLLESKGFEVEVAPNGKVAIEMFEQREQNYYDAILMDIRMPVLDGMSATIKIRQLKKSDSKTIPIIAMTANAFEEDVKKAEESGMNAHLAKPINPIEMFDTLYKFIV